MAVIKTLAAVTRPVLNFLVSISDIKLEIIVQADMAIETMPAYDSGTPISTCIDGHAEPKSESGSPKLIKDRYIIASNKAYIYHLINLYFILMD
jgi:hypothetical protein